MKKKANWATAPSSETTVGCESHGGIKRQLAIDLGEKLFDFVKPCTFVFDIMILIFINCFCVQ